MIANLHLHSRYSDGTLWPCDIAAIGSRVGLEYIALTDHDTLGGSGEMLATAAARGMVPIPGCEIDCAYPEIGFKSELLAYFPDGRFYHTQHFLKEISKLRIKRLRAWLHRAGELYGKKAADFDALARRKLGERYDSVDLDDISFSRVDLFYFLKELDIVPARLRYREFKKRYFSRGLLREEKFRKPHARDVVKAVRSDGGFVVIAHVGHCFDDDFESMTERRDELSEMLARFKEIGVDGVEMYYYRTERDAEMNRMVRKLADPMGYFFTYGSDCHGPGSEKFTIEEYHGRFAGFPKPGSTTVAHPHRKR
jgi:hypothetical protein